MLRQTMWLLLCLAAFVCTTSAQAQQTASELPAREAEARAVFQAGDAAFADARYDDALRYFREAYRLSGRPQLLYNIGVAADRLRRDDEALEAFERFLELAPAQTRQRQDAEVRVRVLREAREARERDAQATPERDATEATPAPDPAPGSAGAGTVDTGQPPPRSGRRSTGYVVLGAGGAVAVTGVILLGLGQADANTVTDAPEGTPYEDVRAEAERADLRRNLGLALLGIGVAGAAAGLTLAVLPVGDSDASARLEVVPGGLRVRGSF